MPPQGVTGRSAAVAWAQATTWGTAASVTKQILIMGTEGWDAQPMIVDDESFNQNFIGEGEVGDHAPVTPDIQAQLRYEQLDSWLAMACGSCAAPVVVSSQAANSLVASTHVITLAKELTQFMTIAADTTRYVKELPSLKLRGFTLSIGDGGRMMVTFPTVGAKAVYDSTVNSNSTVWGATATTLGNRVFRKNGRIRMNPTIAGGLGTSDIASLVREFTFTYARPLAQDDHVVGLDYIIEADDDGFAEMSLDCTYARMNTPSANSMAVAFGAGRMWKSDILFTGPYINSSTQRSLLIEMPGLQLHAFRAPITGNNQVRPQVTFRLKSVVTAPTGMSTLTAPFRLTLVNANSTPLLQ